MHQYANLNKSKIQVYLCSDPSLTPLLLSTRIPTVVTHVMLTYPRYGQWKESEKSAKKKKKRERERSSTGKITATDQIHTSTLTDNHQAPVQRERFGPRPSIQKIF
ncbi:hypothetical protein T4E_8146 [Trichinella pseudospiralis]|uniref:Uncharacterized protein n=1 Tax=Trichinella pseudospiralis TaxID=6337 RepID=A0A0V0XS51_TRIPS|nr:hypothetical protein T4E_8146 [Trichinella pseudospiralis]